MCQYYNTLNFDQIIPWKKIKLRVLSLFDGIGTGLYVLQEKLNLDVEIYFSCEINTDALQVQKLNYHGKIIQLGCVKNMTKEKVHALGRIDLLIGGSPCNDLTRNNSKRKNFEGTGNIS